MKANRQQKTRKKGKLPTLKAVAEHFGRGIDAIHKWRQRGMPGSRRTGYSIQAIERWRARTIDDTFQPQRGNDEVDLRLLRARARRQAAMAKLAEHQLEQKRRAYVPREAADEKCEALLATFRRTLEGLEDDVVVMALGQNEIGIARGWRELARSTLLDLAGALGPDVDNGKE